MNETIARFPATQAARLVGLPQQTLSYWVRHDVLKPAYYDESGWLGYRYFFSFQDLVALRTLRILREHGIPMAKIRLAAVFLQKNFGRPWSSFRLWLHGKDIVFDDPNSADLISATRPGQKAVRELVDLEPLVLEIRAKIEDSEKRAPDELGEFTRSRVVMGGQLVIAGTRIQPSTIWSYHQSGYTAEQIIEEFPILDLKDVLAAIEHERARCIAAAGRRKRSTKSA